MSFRSSCLSGIPNVALFWLALQPSLWVVTKTAPFSRQGENLLKIKIPIKEKNFKPAARSAHSCSSVWHSAAHSVACWNFLLACVLLARRMVFYWGDKIWLKSMAISPFAITFVYFFHLDLSKSVLPYHFLSQPGSIWIWFQKLFSQFSQAGSLTSAILHVWGRS